MSIRVLYNVFVTIGLLILFLLLIALVFGFVFTIWMTVHAIQKSNWRSDDERIMWIVLFVVCWFSGLAFILAIIYYFAYYRIDNKKSPSKK